MARGVRDFFQSLFSKNGHDEDLYCPNFKNKDCASVATFKGRVSEYCKSGNFSICPSKRMRSSLETKVYKRD
ncbi:MAG: hypothetical protein V1818_04070 [Candidatus Aenigmatarchaeota archaeon]